MLLHMRDAAFVRHRSTIVAPQNIELPELGRLAYGCADDRAAAVIALMAAGIVKATSGRVLIAAFDPCVQPVHVKRLTAFVPHGPAITEFATFGAYIHYRAMLWGLSPAESAVRGASIVAELQGLPESFAHPLAGALVAQPRLLVLDRPPSAYAPQIVSAARSCALFSTHASEHDAAQFERACAVIA